MERVHSISRRTGYNCLSWFFFFGSKDVLGYVTRNQVSSFSSVGPCGGWGKMEDSAYHGVCFSTDQWRFLVFSVGRYLNLFQVCTCVVHSFPPTPTTSKLKINYAAPSMFYNAVYCRYHDVNLVHLPLTKLLLYFYWSYEQCINQYLWHRKL